MSKRRQKNVSTKWVTGSVVAAAVLLMGSSFAVASGAIDGSGSMLAGALSAVANAGTTAVTITDGHGTTAHLIPGKQDQYIATFTTSAKNLKWWATLEQVTVDIPITGAGAKDLVLSDITANFKSCIPEGIFYGYGTKSRGECGGYKFSVVSAVRVGNVYKVVLNNHAAIYPQQSVGAITITATPSYMGTGTAFGLVSANVTGASIRGEVCKKVSYGLNNKYSYNKCEGGPASVNVVGARSAALVVDRPSYGYTKRPATRNFWFW